jgi:hypothetical protein
LVLTGISVGSGIVAAEILKNLAKDLWIAVKDCFAKRVNNKFVKAGGKDRVIITMTHGDTELKLSLDNIEAGHENRVQHFLEDAIPKFVQFQREIREDGRSKSPPMVLPPSTEEVLLVFENDQILLSRPLCVACRHLTALYLESPCRTCIHYAFKPGQHRGRPTFSQIDVDGVGRELNDLGEVIPAANVIEYRDRTNNFTPRFERLR